MKSSDEGAELPRDGALNNNVLPIQDAQVNKLFIFSSFFIFTISTL